MVSSCDRLLHSFRNAAWMLLLLVAWQFLPACGFLPSAQPTPPGSSIATPLPGESPTATSAQMENPTAGALPVESPTALPELPALTPAPVESPVPLPETATPTSSPAAAPAAADASYQLEANLNYSLHQLQVQEQIRYTNASGEPLLSLALVVEAHHYLNAFTLQSLQLDPGGERQDYTLDDHLLQVPLANPLLPGRQISLSLRYELALPAIPPPSDTERPQPFGYTERQTNLVDWYPFIPPYRAGQGWIVHPSSFFGEHQVYDVADFQVLIRFAETDPKLVTATSAGFSEPAGGVQTYQLNRARNFVWSVSPIYQVLTATVGAVTVYSYAFPWEISGQQVLSDTQAALKLYSELFGPYQQKSLSVVEADFLDGMEYEGLYFLSRGFYNLYDGTPRGYLTFIAAHETAHQWWYAQVGSDQALEPWLDEALCTYSERLFYERTYPDLLAWWWSFRVNYYQPSGWVNGSIYDYSGFRPYRDAVYLRGAQFLEELRNTMGDQAFFAFLQDYAASENGRLATSNDFFSILKRHTQADLEPLLKIYFKP